MFKRKRTRGDDDSPFAIDWGGKKQEKLSFWLDTALNLIIIIGLVFIIRSYIISPFQVYGPSMCDTMNFFDGKCQKSYGEYIIVNKFGYQNFFGWQVGLPQRGDIIVLHPPHNDQEFYIKRIVGLPGETVKLEKGFVTVFNNEHPEGFQLNEDYLNAHNRGNTHPLGGPDTFTVPEGNYLVFGDNRTQSSDSRSCFSESSSITKCGEGDNTPYLALDHIEGKAAVVLWPITKISLLEDPIYNN